MREEVRLIQEEEQKLTKLMKESSKPLDFDPVRAIFQDPNFIDNTNAAQSIKFMDDLMLDPHSSSEKPIYRQLRNPLIQSQKLARTDAEQFNSIQLDQTFNRLFGDAANKQQKLD